VLFFYARDLEDAERFSVLVVVGRLGQPVGHLAFLHNGVLFLVATIATSCYPWLKFTEALIEHPCDRR
jgi:hypothetical protein